jgi:periplasmic protein TonB
VRQPHRNIVIGGSVVLFHAAALWGLQSGLLRRTVEVIVPVEILSELVRPPTPPKIEPPPPVPRPEPPAPVKPRVVKKAERIPPPAPQPLAVREAPPAPNAPTGVTAPQPPAPPIAAPVAPAPASPAPPPPAPRFEAPVIDADYTANEDLFRPPAISVRLGEYGTVLLRVTVGVNGQATLVELVKSSGYPRLDNAAQQGAKRLRFRPALRGGVPIAATYQLPVKYAEPK